jgi:copper oxidase (laccase) domain-containing protein
VQDDVCLNDLLKTVFADCEPIALGSERGKIIEAVAVGFGRELDVRVLRDCFDDCLEDDSPWGP